MLRLPTRDARSQPTTRRETWLSKALNPASLLPGIIIGFLVGLWVEIPKGGFSRGSSREDPDQPEKQRKGSVGGRNQGRQGSATLTNAAAASDEGGELKMVFVVRQDLKMGGGKIASQCAHAAVGIYNELLTKQRVLLRRWEDCGQPKIVVTCKSQHEMNELRNKADRAGLPTFTVADAGRTQVAAGSKTVLVIGPGAKASVDSITRQLRLL